MRLTKIAAAAAVAVVAATAFGAVPASATLSGTTEGCTPGFWKNHEPWTGYVQGGYTPDTTLSDLFAKRNGPGDFTPYVFPAGLDAFNTMTMDQALQGGGGPGIVGGATILVRAATAAYLNADAEILYPYRRWGIGEDGRQGLQKLVTEALNSKDRTTMTDLAATLDAANNLGCPLS